MADEDTQVQSDDEMVVDDLDENDGEEETESPEQ